MHNAKNMFFFFQIAKLEVEHKKKYKKNSALLNVYTNNVRMYRTQTECVFFSMNFVKTFDIALVSLHQN